MKCQGNRFNVLMREVVKVCTKVVSIGRTKGFEVILQANTYTHTNTLTQRYILAYFIVFSVVIGLNN